MARESLLPLSRSKLARRSFELRGAEGFSPAAAASDAMDVNVLEKPAGWTWKDWSIFLLHTAAEVEHSLLVQYLYAAYSINLSQADPEHQAIVERWSEQLRSIAREEMGHLLMVQNLLHCLGGALNFEREDFPFRTRLYPFRYRLRPLSLSTLAKFVLAEMPPEGVPETILPRDERRTIEAHATSDESDWDGGAPVNQVGLLYDTLRDALLRLPDAAYLPDPPDGGAELFQSGTNDWGASESPDPPTGVKVVRAVDKASALSVVATTALQGEGAGAASLEFSHFMRFLTVYRELRDAPGEWDAVLPVVTDPNVDDPPNGTTITHPVTRQWANLFNARYRILLTSLSHGLSVPQGDDRALLLSWVFEEMAWSPGSLSILAAVLCGLDLHEGPDSPKAGAPFTLPYSLAIPNREPDRWRLHYELLLAARQILDQIDDEIARSVIVQDGEDDSQGRRKQVVDRLPGNS